uniref:Uncharacterized protein n=1 Tax=Tanacetum cinerariifolium TaxID=118510 RepID=A0A699R5N3_TANCI|nr:hypothetical protein [Tanacetum cinerariifolium]
MVNIIPPDHIDDVPVVEPNQHDDVPIVLEPVLVDENEDLEEEEFEEDVLHPAKAESQGVIDRHHHNTWRHNREILNELKSNI